MYGLDLHVLEVLSLIGTQQAVVVKSGNTATNDTR